MPRLYAVLVLCLSVTACASPSQPDSLDGPDLPSPTDTTTPEPNPPAPTAYDLDTLGVPQFVTASYIDPAYIGAISKFRSGVGHDYSDNVETCRSMKHYFQPRSSVDWRFVPVVAPVTGRIVRADPEWAGVQLHVQPDAQPFFRVVLFHVSPDPGVGIGSSVTSGERIGAHVGYQTMSDVAVAVEATDGYRLVSYFDAMNDGTFARFQARGVPSRSDAIISRAARDGQPLSCSGESFNSGGPLENWIPLQ